ncbi:hypothetical protein LTR28_011290 [Elasticomyces elasticus]|nr:hypothetical protein LTR28_011290 [Elasticomyces elasticus]
MSNGQWAMGNEQRVASTAGGVVESWRRGGVEAWRGKALRQAKAKGKGTGTGQGKERERAGGWPLTRTRSSTKPLQAKPPKPELPDRPMPAARLTSDSREPTEA